MEEIDERNRKFAHRLFHCVAAASRPLLVNELAEFLAFDFEAGSTPTFLADWRPDDPTHTVLSICSSLLAVVRQDGGSPVVQFAHFSVKEYLTSARLAEAKGTISQFHVSMTTAHSIVAQACLGLLLHLDENTTKDSLENFPLAQYAAEYWVGHAWIEDVSSSVEDGMKRIFDPSGIHLSIWTWLYDPEDSRRRYEYSEFPEEARATPLHYAAFCGMHDVVKALIVKHPHDVHARGFDKKETPLHTASRCGHTEARDKSGQSLLELASSRGHVKVARVLLEYGADLGSQDEQNNTPLHVAQDEEVTRLLLDHGADANVLDIHGWTPLHLASVEGRVGAARVLLEHGVDSNARDASNATPLHLASRWGHSDGVRSLLEYGSDISARDNKGQTPFMNAAERGNDEVMQLLLEYGAEDHRK